MAMEPEKRAEQLWSSAPLAERQNGCPVRESRKRRLPGFRVAEVFDTHADFAFRSPDAVDGFGVLV